MSHVPRPLVGFALVLVLAASASGQFDTNGPNATLKIQQKIASVVDPIDHDVSVAIPGTLDLQVESGANPITPVILFASQVDPTGPILFVPWGGSLDLGAPGSPISNVVIVGDGLSLTNPLVDQFFFTDAGDPVAGTPPTMRIQYPTNPLLDGVHQAFQCVLLDNTQMPFPFDNTEVVDANFQFGQEVNLQTGEDGNVKVNFLPPQTFNFHGVNYSEVWVSANGFISFGGAPGLVNAGFDQDNVAWLNDRPSIAPLLADWSPDGLAPTDGVLYQEFASTLRIAWGDPQTTSGPGVPHFADNDANQFEVVLQMANGGNPSEGQFSILTPMLDPSAITDLGDGLLGHTPGGVAILGTTRDRSLRSNMNVNGSNIAQIEEHDLSGNSATSIGWNGTGSPRTYNDVTTNWNGGGRVDFTPNPTGGVTGANGYTSTPSGPTPADDFQGIDLPQLDLAGGETATASGSFFGFDPMANGSGTVVFDPNGIHGGPFNATVVSILDGTGMSGPLSAPNPQPGPVRDGQGLVFTTPVFPVQGSYDLRINFQSGLSRSTTVVVSAAGTVLTSYTLRDDTVQLHGLTVPIQFYGTTYTEVRICSNGFVQFVAGSVAPNPTMQDFFDGFQAGGGTANPGVAALWTDLNRFFTTNGATYDVTEDTVNGTVEVSFTNQEYWSTADPAGTAKITFGVPAGANPSGLGNVRMDLTGVLAASNPNVQSVVFGVTDGNSVLNGTGTGPELDLTAPMQDGTGLFSMIPQGGAMTGFSAGGSNASVGELYKANVALPFTGPFDFIEMDTAPSGGNWFIDG